MGIISTRKHFEYNRRCDFCHRPRKDLYHVNLGDFSIFVCSGMEAEEARKNYQFKKDNNVQPGVPMDISTPPSDEMLDGSLPEE